MEKTEKNELVRGPKDLENKPNIVRNPIKLWSGILFTFKSCSFTPKFYKWSDSYVLRVMASIIFWYGLGMTSMCVNKFLFGILKFDFPLAASVICLSFTCAILFVISFITTALVRPKISREIFFKLMVPISIFTSLEIAFSNMAYSSLPISLITVLKSSSVFVTYAISVLCNFEKLNKSLLLTVMFIMAAIIFSVEGMRIEKYEGIVFVAASIIIGSIKWISVFKSNHQNFLPLQLLYLTQPLSAFLLLPPCLFYEMTSLTEFYKAKALAPKELATLAGLVFLMATLGFLLILLEYDLVAKTSPLTLTVAGAGKEIATIIMSVIVFNERLNRRSVSGIAFSILGIVTYTYLRLASCNHVEARNKYEGLENYGPEHSLESQNSVELTIRKTDSIKDV